MSSWEALGWIFVAMVAYAVVLGAIEVTKEWWDDKFRT